MRYWHPTPEGGAGEPGEASGDAGANPAAETAAEAGSGAETGQETAREEADRARDEFIAQKVQQGIEAALPQIISRIQSSAPAAPAATPPTAGRGVVSALEAEAAAIQAETARLDAAFVADGYTAKNLADQNRLAMRLSNFNAQLLAHGMQMQEAERHVEKAGSSDDDAKAAAWRKFAGENPGVPVRFLRPTFEKEYAATHPATPAKPKPGDTAGARAAAAAVSGASEVSAREARTRTINRADYDREVQAAEDRGDFAKVSELGRSVRSGRLLVKG
jgi:fibronectin type 3 domain-containing protein